MTRNAARLDRILGTLSRRHPVVAGLPLRNREDALRLLEQAANDLIAGRLDHRTGSALASLMARWLDAYDTRLAERALAEIADLREQLRRQRQEQPPPWEKLPPAAEPLDALDDDPAEYLVDSVPTESEPELHRNGLIEMPADEADEDSPLFT